MCMYTHTHTIYVGKTTRNKKQGPQQKNNCNKNLVLNLYLFLRSMV